MRGIVSILLLAALAVGPAAAGTITYQGSLEQSGTPFSGTVRMIFALAEDEQSAPFERLDAIDVAVVNGVFQAELEFSAGAFAASPRWLEISVDGTILGDRQKITAVPFALNAGGGDGGSVWSVSGSDITYQGGNVGIGVASPQRRLQVSGSAIFGRPDNTAGMGDSFVSGGLAFSPNSAAGQSTFVGGGFGNATSATAAFAGGGRDNTASGSHAFVAGGRNNTGQGSNSFIAGGVANTTAGASALAAGNRAKALHDNTFCGSSSERYKTRTEDFADGEASTLLHSLRPVHFRWINDDRKDIGLIAEEVAEVLPQIVHYAADSTVNGFEYNRLDPLLIAGFQEQTATNAQRFAALETEHARFASENTRLKSAQQDLAQENAELRAEVSVLKVQSGQVHELERRLAVMEERERANEGLRERLAALEALLIDGMAAVAEAGR